MPEITYAESLRQINDLERKAEDAGRTGEWEKAVDRWRAVLAHPCAHQVVDYEVLDEIYQVLRRASRWDEAIAAKREAIAAGYRSRPDPEADIAECLLAAGRRVEADELYAVLRERDPDEVWLYNSAAYSYTDVDDLAALQWSLDGIDLALTTGAPDQVVTQLLECADRSWAALGLPADAEVIARVETFCEAWKPIADRHCWADTDPHVGRRCGYCGYDPNRSRAELDEMARRRRRRLLEAEDPDALARLDHAFGGPESERRLTPEARLAVGWFPAEEWPVAIERWPDLLDELPADHPGYSHAIESRVKRIARHLAGRPLNICALTVAGLEGFATAEDCDAGSAETRSAYAARLLHQGTGVRWPPGRNSPCWC